MPQPSPDLWTTYRARFVFLTDLCSSTPADPDVIQAWLAARTPRVKPAGAPSIEEINEEVLASLERGEGDPDQSFSLLVFQRHEGMLVMRAATVKAHFKDCARVLSSQFVGRIQGERAFSTRVINGVYLDETQYWLAIGRPDGTPITAPDGTRDKPIHVRGPRGEMLNALKRFEYIAPPSVLEFNLKVLGKSVSETDLHHLLSYGGTHGYAGERSDGEGRYHYTIERVVTTEAGAAAADRRGDSRKERANPRRDGARHDHSKDGRADGPVLQDADPTGETRDRVHPHAAGLREESARPTLNAAAVDDPWPRS